MASWTALVLLVALACAETGKECEAGAQAGSQCAWQEPQGASGSSMMQTSHMVEQKGVKGALHEKSNSGSSACWAAAEAILGPRWTSLVAEDFTSFMCLELLACSIGVSAYLLWRHLRGSKLGFRQAGVQEDEDAQKLPASGAAAAAAGAAEGEAGVASVEKADADTALRAAVWAGAAPLVAELLRCGASATMPQGPRRETPLHCAAKAGDAEVCRLLLDAHADIDPVDSRGFTPLIIAAGAGWEATCELLLDRGAGAGGLSDEELPPLLTNLLVKRIFSEVEPPEAAQSSAFAAGLVDEGVPDAEYEQACILEDDADTDGAESWGTEAAEEAAAAEAEEAAAAEEHFAVLLAGDEEVAAAEEQLAALHEEAVAADEHLAMLLANDVERAAAEEHLAALLAGDEELLR